MMLHVICCQLSLAKLANNFAWKAWLIDKTFVKMSASFEIVGWIVKYSTCELVGLVVK
jgi:hypothetical protein